jgi:hypothetical protein
MAIRTQQSQVFWTIVLPIAVDVLDLDGDSAGDWMLPCPSALRASPASGIAQSSWFHSSHAIIIAFTSVNCVAF